jgi:hypothetical protein
MWRHRREIREDGEYECKVVVDAKRGKRREEQWGEKGSYTWAI